MPQQGLPGKGTVVKEVIECPYCHQSAAYEIPYEYTEKEIIIRGIQE